MHTTLFIVGLLACGLFASAAAAEDWAGLGGGGLRHNAAATSVDPGGLAKLWQRSFPCLPIGDQAGPNNERDLAAGKGARNLVLADGRVALIATERADVPNAEHDYYLTVLDAATGRTATSVRIRSSRGNSRVYRWPHYGVSMSGDNVTGIVQVGWDAETGILFAAQGAYNASYTAWLPMADAGDPPPGAPADAVPAFARLRAEHPGLQDAFGRTAADLFTVFGPSDLRDRLEPFTWGLSGCFIAAAERNKEKPARYDSDWQTLFGRQGSSYYNTSGYFSVDPAGPLIVQCKGADWGHNSAGDAYVFNITPA